MMTSVSMRRVKLASATTTMAALLLMMSVLVALGMLSAAASEPGLCEEAAALVLKYSAQDNTTRELSSPSPRAPIQPFRDFLQTHCHSQQALDGTKITDADAITRESLVLHSTSTRPQMGSGSAHKVRLAEYIPTLSLPPGTGYVDPHPLQSRIPHDLFDTDPDVSSPGMQPSRILAHRHQAHQSIREAQGGPTDANHPDFGSAASANGSLHEISEAYVYRTRYSLEGQEGDFQEAVEEALGFENGTADGDGTVQGGPPPPLICALSSASDFCVVPQVVNHSHTLEIVVDQHDQRYRLTSLQAIARVIRETTNPSITHVRIRLRIERSWNTILSTVVNGVGDWSQIESLSVVGFDTRIRSATGTLNQTLFLPFQHTLRELHIHVNNLQLRADNFKFLSVLRKLNLSESTILSFPAAADVPIFRGLDGVIELDLSNNNFSRVPEDLFVHLPNLQRLLMHRNIITELPETLLSPLTNLSIFSLYNNQLQIVPSDLFTNLPNPSLLRVLDLSSNFLHELPQVLFRALSNIELINLGANHFDQLHVSTFAGLSKLSTLSLSNNHITSINNPALFHDLTSLRSLVLTRNHISSIPNADVFQSLSQLRTLRLDLNHISQLTATLFSKLTSLTTLGLSNNTLTHIPAELFQNNRNLTRCFLNNNRIQTLSPMAFQSQARLHELGLDQNPISTIPEGLFDHLTSLWVLYLMHNQFTALPPRPFQHMVQLRWLFSYGGELQRLEPDTLFGATRLREAYLNHNRLTAIPTELFDHTPALRLIFLQHNAITAITPAHLDTLPGLEWLNINRNQITEYSVDLLSHATGIRVFYGRGNPVSADWAMFAGHSALQRIHLEDVRVLHVDDYRSYPDPTLYHYPDLQTLSLTATRFAGDAPGFLLSLKEGLGEGLTQFSAGWDGLDDTIVPFELWCDILSPISTIALFGMVRTNYRHINVCVDRVRAVATAFINSNPLLESIHVGAIGGLDATNNPSLSALVSDTISVADISFSNIPYTTRLCRFIGQRTLFANALRHPSFHNEDNALDLLTTCLLQANLIDFSLNSFLANLPILQAAASRPVLLGSYDYFENEVLLETGEEPVTRPEVPLLILENTPVTCGINIRLVELLSGLTGVSYSFSCSCSPGHRLEGSTCVVDALSSAEIAGISIGSVIVVLAVVIVIVRRMLTKRARERLLLSNENELKQRLLEEQEVEVAALKNAWEIQYTELGLLEKIDEGAFGEVWRAEWDTLVVAVKFMKEAFSAALDPTTYEEFGKELDFLRRTRHPNLVRFFGTGKDPNGAPFIVLEFVANGSLFSLIKTGLDGALERYWDECKRGAMQTRKQHALSPPQSLHSVNGSKNRGDAAISGVLFDDVSSKEQLILRLLRDIACGMMFIHEQHILHRDLKSGNVLVSQRLVAKLTDFGSMRRCLKGVSADDGDSLRKSEDSSQVDDGMVVINYAPDDPNFTQTVSSSSFPLCCGSASLTAHQQFTAGVGTPLYMAPEMLVMSKSYTSKADVFSFGIIMWEIQTGRLPDLVGQEVGDSFRGPFYTKLHQLLSEGCRLRFDSSDPAVPEWYEALYLKCLDFEPDRRPAFQDVYDLLSAQFMELVSTTSST